MVHRFKRWPFVCSGTHTLLSKHTLKLHNMFKIYPFLVLFQETVGFILSIGSVGSILGATLYQLVLKDHPFRGICLWTQLLFALAGMLDLVLVLRLNLIFGLPDYLFIVVDEVVSQMIGRLKWMPLLVLTSKLCPHGIEGTFFALLMSIDNAGFMTSSWLGGAVARPQGD